MIFGGIFPLILAGWENNFKVNHLLDSISPTCLVGAVPVDVVVVHLLSRWPALFELLLQLLPQPVVVLYGLDELLPQLAEFFE